MRLSELEKKISFYKMKLRTTKRKRDICTILKLLNFIGIFFFLFSFKIVIFFLLIFIFVLLSYLDNKLLICIEEKKGLITCFLTEINYLKGDFCSLLKGEQYINKEHPYTFDLDIFGDNSLFQAINRTVTPNGNQKLAYLLQNLCIQEFEIKERQDAVKEFISKIDWTYKFRVLGYIYPISSAVDDSRILSIWKSNKSIPFKKWRIFLFAFNFSVIISFVLSLFSLVTCIWFFCFMGLQLILVLFFVQKINKMHVLLGAFIKANANYFYLIEHINKIEVKSARLVFLKEKLLGNNNALFAFKDLHKIKNSFDQRGNFLASFFLNALYAKDLYTFIKLEIWKSKFVDHMEAWVDVVAEFDSLISMANYAYNHPNFIMPDINRDNIINAVSIAHPLLRNKDVVGNNITIKNNMFIVTGANMTGKSTFLRSIGVNLVLASSGNVVFSKEFSFTPMKIFTSMRTTDNLAKGLSYFHAELIRLHMLLRNAKNHQPLFIILDELLKGTNFEDRINASFKFLKKISTFHVFGLIATHDTILCKLAKLYPSKFRNLYFEINCSGTDRIVYDYKIKEGISRNTNVSILLEKMILNTNNL